jgi:hypothetical protein
MGTASYRMKQMNSLAEWWLSIWLDAFAAATEFSRAGLRGVRRGFREASSAFVERSRNTVR